MNFSLTHRQYVFSALASIVVVVLTIALAFMPQQVAHAATFVITKLADTNDGVCDSDCSLREAITASNSVGGSNTITMSPGLTGTFSLFIDRLPSLSGNLTLIGNGATQMVISAAVVSEPVFIVNAGATLSISNLGISQGAEPSGRGGGIQNAGTLTLTNAIVRNNTAFEGGAISNTGTLTLNHTNFTDNTVTSAGGAIYNTGSLTINGGSFSGNQVVNGRGGAIYNTGALTINGAVMSGNQSSDRGGAIYSSSVNGDALTITGSSFSNNQGSIGGALTIADALTMTNSIIVNNTATLGGGIFITAPATFTNTTISGNSATTSTGGLYFEGGAGESIALQNTLIANNTGGTDCNRFSGTINASHSLVETGFGCINGTSVNNLSADPQLNPDFTLQSTSPAINTGDNSLILAATDIAGNPRIQQGVVDMGAYESPFTPPLSTVTISPGTLGFNEGENNNFVISRTGQITSALAVTLTITPGTDMDVSDYTLSGGDITGQMGTVTVTIPAGSNSVNLNFAAINDTIQEANETLTLTLLAEATYNLGATISSVATIVANDLVPEVTITPAALSVNEGNDSVFTVTRTGSTTAALLVRLNIAPGSGMTTADYLLFGAPITGQTGTITLTMAAGRSSVNISIDAINDAMYEPDETLTVSLVSRPEYTLGTSTTTTISIPVNDTEPTLSIDDVAVTEGNTGTVSAIFTVALSNPSWQTITVNYETGDNDAVAPGDYIATSGTLTFTPGEISKLVTVVVNGDYIAEVYETFSVTLSDPVNATILQAVGTGTINEDDLINSHVVPSFGFVTSEDGTMDTFTIVLNSQPTADVHIAIVSEDTTEGTVSPDTITFTSANWSVAQTITITGVDDALTDGDVEYDINVGPATSADPGYNGHKPSDIRVRNTDNDSVSLVVTNTNDSGPGSLRQAILNANISGGVVDATGVSGTITLIVPITVSNNITIEGPGAANLTVTASGFRVFTVTSGTVLFRSFTISGGGMEVSGGSVTIGNSPMIITGNTTTNCGGGLLVSGGTVTVQAGSQIHNNTTTDNGGGICVTAGSLFVAGPSTQVNGNSAVNGGGIFASGGSVTVQTGSAVNNNTALGSGGAIYIGVGASLTVTDSYIFDNGAASSDGIYSASGGSVTNTCIVGNGDTAVVNTSGTLSATNNWWGTNWGPNIPGAPTLTGSAVSSGDSIGGTGEASSSVNVGIATAPDDYGTYSTPPTGNWQLTAPIGCATCTAPSGVGSPRLCVVPRP